MKKLSITLSFFLVFPSLVFANELGKNLYGSLMVNEVNISQGEGMEILKKEIPGISCIKKTIIYPHALPSYGCAFNTEMLNSKELYESLSIEEVMVEDGRVGAEIFVKKMKDLVCKKTLFVVPKPVPHYDCKINLVF